MSFEAGISSDLSEIQGEQFHSDGPKGEKDLFLLYSDLSPSLILIKAEVPKINYTKIQNLKK